MYCLYPLCVLRVLRVCVVCVLCLLVHKFFSSKLKFFCLCWSLLSTHLASWCIVRKGPSNRKTLSMV